MAVDLDACQLPQGNLEQAQLRTLIKYFWIGTTTTFTTATIMNPNDDQRELLATIKARLTAIATVLILLGENLDQDLTAAPNNPGFLIVPNAQALELLVACILQVLPINANLGDLKARMVASRVVFRQLVNAQPLNSRAHVGLPVVVFVCMTDRLVAFSKDKWDALKTYENALRDFRYRRFSIDPIVDSMVDKRHAVFNRLTFIQDWCELNVATFRNRANACTLTPNEYNLVVASIYETRPDGPLDNNSVQGGQPLGRTFGYNHRPESGRAFRASGQEMFMEMSRCWKCRFLYQYDIPRPGQLNNTGLIAEEPTQTAWNCNIPLCCAEDLCHYRCRDTRRNLAPLNPNQQLAFLPYP